MKGVGYEKDLPAELGWKFDRRPRGLHIVSERHCALGGQRMEGWSCRCFGVGALDLEMTKNGYSVVRS